MEEIVLGCALERWQVKEAVFLVLLVSPGMSKLAKPEKGLPLSLVG